ncbi:MAG: stage III sporulation protein AG [Eubacteriales bacterium]
MKFTKEIFSEKLNLGIIFIIVVAVIFVLFAKSEDKSVLLDQAVEPVAAVPVEKTDIEILENNLEEKISDSLGKMKGVGKVEVIVTFSTGFKKEYVRDESVTKRTSKETDKEGGTRETVEVTENNQLVVPSNSLPILIIEERPQIAGVLVIAEGAINPQIKEQIFQSVRVLLNIEPVKINVVPMEGV